MKTTNVTFKMIEALAKKGLNATNAAKQLGVKYHVIHYILQKEGVKFSEINVQTPQTKAWDSRKKQKAIDKYNSATSTGIKASIARKFNAEFGVSLKDVLATKVETVVKEKKAPKVATTKITFEQKEEELTIPYFVKDFVNVLFEKLYIENKTLNKRIETLEKAILSK